MNTAVYLKAFRKRLVLAIVDREADTIQRFFRVPKEHMAELAEHIGLAPSLLKEVMELAIPANVAAPVITSLDVKWPAPLRPYLEAAAKKHGFEWDAPRFARSLLHAVMQTEHEPAYRPRVRKGSALLLTDPHPKGRRIKPASAVKSAAKNNVMPMRVSFGLHGALRARAHKRGESTRVYCEHWLLDAIDDLLPKSLFIESVKVSELFPRPENYVLPAPNVALTPEPESDTIERNSP